MRHTDPTGHTISDVEEGLVVLGGLIVTLAIVGATMRALIPVFLLGGILGFALALFFYVLILILIALIFHIMGEILDLLFDDFDHFESDRPTDDVASTDPGGLPQEPDEGCPTDLGSLLGSFNPADPLFGSFLECSCVQEALDVDFALDGSPLALILDAAGLLVLGLAAFLFWGLTDPTNIGFIVFIAGAFGFLSLVVTCAEAGLWTMQCLSSMVLFGATMGVGVTAKQLATGAAVDTIGIYKDLFGCW